MRKSALVLILLVAIFFPLFKASAETVGISAVVPANNSDFSAEIATSDITDPVGQAHIFPFTITYSNKLSYATTITLKATWSKGTIQGDLTPSTDVLHYVGSSASDGYSNSSPVIDTLNRTIPGLFLHIQGIILKILLHFHSPHQIHSLHLPQLALK